MWCGGVVCGVVWCGVVWISLSHFENREPMFEAYRQRRRTGGILATHVCLRVRAEENPAGLQPSPPRDPYWEERCYCKRLLAAGAGQRLSLHLSSNERVKPSVLEVFKSDI